MGEALLVKYGGAASQETIIQQDSCALIVTVLDPLGRPVLANTPVNCNDSGQWYNYQTNDKGQVLFRVRTGVCNINASNYSQISTGMFGEEVWYFDLQPTNVRVTDCQLNTQKDYNLTLPYHSSINNGYARINKDNSNIRFLATNTIDVLLLGGGGGGNVMSAGCGAAINIGRGIAVDRNTTYHLEVGYGYSSTGGSSSAFGLSAVGGSKTGPGGSGSFMGGRAGSAPNWNNSTIYPFNINRYCGYGGGTSTTGTISAWYSVTTSSYSNTRWGLSVNGNSRGRSYRDPFKNSMGYLWVYFNHNGANINTGVICFGVNNKMSFSSASYNPVNNLNMSNLPYNTYYKEAQFAGQGGCITIGTIKSEGGNGFINIRRNS